MQHSIIPPSSAGIWGAPEGCTGWVKMAQLYPEPEDNPEAAEGTAAHEVGQRMIEGFRVGQNLMKSELWIDQQASNGIVITEEIFEGALMYAEIVTSSMREHGIFGGEYLGIEGKIECPDIHAESFGTVDFWMFDTRQTALILTDFKFGFVNVEAFENWQLINYASGLVRRLGLHGFIEQGAKIIFQIVQPRAYHPGSSKFSEWTIKAEDIRPYTNTLHMNAHKALSDQAELRTGSHCRNCSARHACAPALKAGLGLYEMTAKPIPQELTPAALGVQLSIIKRAKEQLELLETGYEAQVQNLMMSGRVVPGWEVQPVYGREKWKKSVKEVIKMGEMMHQDLKKPDAVITPNQARKKGIDDAILEVYAETPKTGVKVLPVDNSKVKRIFKS